MAPVAFIPCASVTSRSGGQGSKSSTYRRRSCLCLQPPPLGSQLVDYIFVGGTLGLLVGAGFLLRNGFAADITSSPNRTESINLPRVQAYNPTVMGKDEEPKQKQKGPKGKGKGKGRKNSRKDSSGDD